MASVYFSAITTITIGFGDFYPVNTVERIYIIFMCLITCCVFAYTVNKIGEIVQSISRRSNEFQKKMKILNGHMIKRGISQELQMNVKKYFEYLFQEELEENNEQAEEMLNKLRGNLKLEVLTEIYTSVLKNLKLFSLNFSREFISELSIHMKERRLGPEEIIFQQGQLLNELCIILKGNVQHQVVMQNKQIRTVKSYLSGDAIGVISYFSGTATDFQAKTLDVVQYAYITKADFLRVLQRFDKDFEIYSRIKDSLVLKNYSRGIDQKCPCCGYYTHQQISHCPFIFANIHKDIVISRYCLEDSLQDRRQCRRAPDKFINPMKNLKVITESAIDIITDNTPEDQF